MLSTQVTPGTPTAYGSAESLPDRTATSERGSTTGRPRAATLPTGERREIPGVIYHRFKREDASRLYGSSPALYGSSPGGSQGLSSDGALGGIWHQLRTICEPAQALEWKPVPGILDTLSGLAKCVRDATATEKEAISAMLNSELATATAHRETDITLFKTAIDRTLQGEDPMEVLGELAETSLVLPKFTIRVDGEEEPSQKHFDSTLPSFASGSYDHGPLGRTLILEGGRARFAGPSQAQRVEKLREIIFALPNPPESGEPLDGMADIFQALMALGIDI